MSSVPKSEARAKSVLPQPGQSVKASDDESVSVYPQSLQRKDPAPTKVPVVSDSMSCSSLSIAAPKGALPRRGTLVPIITSLSNSVEILDIRIF